MCLILLIDEIITTLFSIESIIYVVHLFSLAHLSIYSLSLTFLLHRLKHIQVFIMCFLVSKLYMDISVQVFS